MIIMTKEKRRKIWDEAMKQGEARILADLLEDYDLQSYEPFIRYVRYQCEYESFKQTLEHILKDEGYSLDDLIA